MNSGEPYSFNNSFTGLPSIIQENIKTLPGLNLSYAIDSTSSSSEVDTFLNELMESLVKHKSMISGEFYNDILHVALDNKISISKFLILRKNIPNEDPHFGCNPQDYVHVEKNGDVYELSDTDIEHLSFVYEGGDGGRPNINEYYKYRNESDYNDGLFERKKLPEGVKIKPRNK